MKTKSAEVVDFTLNPDNLPPLTERQKAELAALAALSDEEINYEDIPQTPPARLDSMRRGQFYRPVKQQITARVDADVLHWLKAQGKGYQARMNAILRREMIASLQAKRDER